MSALRVVTQPDLPAALIVARPIRGDREVLVVLNPTTPRTEVRRLARCMLRADEREQLAAFLAA
jgi:hypothetical protein